MKKQFHQMLVVAMVLLISGCATSPDKIQTSYVSPIQYQNYECNQVAGELERVSRLVNEKYGHLKKTSETDNAQMAVGLILFWPALFFLEGGDGPEAQEFARLKGERDALEKVAIQKGCDPSMMPKIVDQSEIDKKNKQNKKEAKVSNKKSGTGFFINNSGYLITNYHVVKDAKDIKVKTTDNKDGMTAVVMLKDVSNYIVILKVSSAPSWVDNNIYFGESSKMKVGDKVSTMGYPYSNILGKEPRYSEGVINALYGVQDDPRLFQVSVPIQKGSSGSPLFNENGEVIGIVVASLDAKKVFEITGSFPQNVNFAIKSAYIKNLISMIPDLGATLVQPTDLSIQPINFTDSAKNNIVRIEAK